MKTTFELPDRLFQKAKSTAARRGQTLRQLFTDAIAEKLDAIRKGRREKPWMRHYGSLQRHEDELERIDQVVEEEFGSVDPEDWK